MKAITKISLLITWMFLTFSLSAQRPHWGSRMGGEGLIWEQLELSDAQQDAITLIRQTHRKEVMQIRSNQDLDMESKRDAIKELTETFKAKIEAELTEDQKTKLAEHKEALDQKMESRREQMEEKQAYLHENVLPKLIEIRKDFNENISTEDQTIIADLRAKKPAVRQRKSRRPSGLKPGAGRINQSREKRTLTEEERTAAKEHAQTLKAMVAKYYDDIQEVFEANQSLFDELRENRRPEKTLEETPDQQAMHKRHRKGQQSLFSPEIRFLLMPLELNDATLPKQGFGNNLNSTLKVFPNPSSERIRIEYAIDSKGPVNIQVLDQNGIQIKSFPQGIKGEGNYVLNLENLNLNSGTYFLQVITKTGKTSQKVIITN